MTYLALTPAGRRALEDYTVALRELLGGSGPAEAAATPETLETTRTVV